MSLEKVDTVAIQTQKQGSRKKKNFELWVSAFCLSVLVIVLLFGDWIVPHDPYLSVGDSLSQPSSEYLFGTDSIGRDVLSRVIIGAKATMIISLSSVLFALIFGTIIGLIAAYYGGWVDQIIMRTLDVIFAFPTFLLAIAVVGVLGNTIPNLIFTIGIVYTPTMARIVRGPALSIRSWEHVTAAKLIGVRDAQIITRHVFPIALTPVLVETSLLVANTVFTITALSFLGLGTPPPDPNWGTMLSESRQFMEIAPFSAVGPSLAIVFAAFSFIMLSAGLRRYFNVQSSR